MPRLAVLRHLSVTLLVAGAFAALPALAAVPGGLPSDNVAWLVASADADIERAFGQARTQKKPVLLYWGATWCPPCNQLKATLFNRHEFAAQSRHFVAVFVDGDRPAAQKLGARFKVSGYPTLVLFTPDGAEITRLPGEADAPQVLSLLATGLAGGRPIAQVLADAQAGRPLTANEWRMLSFHAWSVDGSGLVAEADRPAVLADLASKAQAANPGDGETTTRLWLKALAESDDGKGLKSDEALRQRVLRVLGDPAASRLHMDVLIYGAPDMVKALTADDSAERAALVAQFEATLQRLQNDTTLARGDRMVALYSRVSLARLGQPKDSTTPKLPEALVNEVREMAARFDREITDGYERQAVITNVGSMLGYAGLWSESEALLKANLSKSHSPYYLMSQLGSNARKLGRKDEALDWFRKAYEASEGPATRLQWGASYLSALVDLAPNQGARIEKTAIRIFNEAAKDKGALHERSARSLQRVGKKLASWNADGKQSAAMKRIQASVQALCGKVGASEREACQALLPAPGAAKG